MTKSLFLTGINKKYPEELLKGTLEAEGNVCAAIFKDPLLLDDSALTKDCFITKDGRFYFGLAKMLRERGLYVFDEVSILTNSSPEVLERFNENGGYDQIESMTNVINTNNWESYLGALHRKVVLRKLYADGFNVMQDVTINNKTINQLKLFDKMSAEEIMEYYEVKLASYESGYSTKILEEEEIDFDDEFFDSCEEGLENGVPFATAGEDVDGEEITCLPYLSNHIMGFEDGTFSIVGGYSSTGKSTLYVTILMGLLEDPNRKALIISNEMQCKAYKINLVVWTLCKRFKYFNITKKKLMSGNLTTEDKKMLKKAQEYWREKYKGRLKFVSIPTADMSLVKREIRKNVLRFGYNIALYDTMKLDFNSSPDKKEYLSLIKDSRDFDEISKKYNIIMLASLQLAISTLGKLFLDASVLAQSKQIKEVCQNLILIRTIYGEELDSSSKFYLNPYRLKKVNGKWIREEHQLDPQNVYRAIFIDKCRTASNSSDTGQALCYKYKGEFAIFTETAWIQPKHGFIQ